MVGCKHRWFYHSVFVKYISTFASLFPTKSLFFCGTRRQKHMPVVRSVIYFVKVISVVLRSGIFAFVWNHFFEFLDFHRVFNSMSKNWFQIVLLLSTVIGDILPFFLNLRRIKKGCQSPKLRSVLLNSIQYAKWGCCFFRILSVYSWFT